MSRDWYFLSLPCEHPDNDVESSIPCIFNESAETFIRDNDPDNEVVEFFMLDQSGGCEMASDYIEGADPEERWWPMRHWALIVPTLEQAVLFGLRLNAMPVLLTPELSKAVEQVQQGPDWEVFEHMTFEQYSKLFGPHGWFCEEFWEDE